MKLVAQNYNSQSREIKVIYISTYIPRECGIATFTKDLTSAINLLNPNNLAEIMALEEKGAEERSYPWEVKYRVKDYDLLSIKKATDYVNQSGSDIVSIQHEFGIFGPDEGSNVIEFLKKIKKPIVVTFHTVLSNPSDTKKRIVKTIGKYSSAIVVMINDAKKRLVDVYNIDPEKIVVIPHGVPDIPYGPTGDYKKELKISYNKIVLSTFGLINRGKGIEYVLEAMTDLVKVYPNLFYIIIGQTHPIILKKEGEIYRESLQKFINQHKIQNNVKFVNSYLPLDKLVKYLRATDIYITPYLEPQQITSGTLAYAVGAGKTCISTKYLYAKEVLGYGRGMLVDFSKSQEIVDAVNQLLSDKSIMNEMSMKAYLYGRKMIWPSVALGYLDLFNLIKKHNDQP